MTEPADDVPPTSPDAPTIAQQSFQDFQQGNQPGAIARIQPLADEGQPWAIALLVFIFMQQGLEGFPKAVPYAQRAQVLGMPWVAANLFNNMIGNVAGSPQLLEPALSLLVPGPALMAGVDPVGQAWNLLSQNQPDAAVRLLSVRGWYPPNAEAWNVLLADTQSKIQLLGEHVVTASTRASEVQAAAQASIDAIHSQEQNLETVAKQANLLVTSISSDAVNTLFNADAARHNNESKTAWKWGIAILASAAGFAILPLLLHYIGHGPDLKSNGLLAAHITSTVALGVVAGVLLARARNRDRAAQRASDISTAMGTVISYSNRIADEAEKQKFMLAMGQLVLQAHLQPDLGATPDPVTGLAALLGALRSSGT